MCATIKFIPSCCLCNSKRHIWQWGNNEEIILFILTAVLLCYLVSAVYWHVLKRRSTRPGHHGEWWDYERVISEQWSIDVQSQLNSYLSTFSRNNDKIIFTKLVQNNLELFLETISLPGSMLMWFKKNLQSTTYFSYTCNDLPPLSSDIQHGTGILPVVWHQKMTILYRDKL